MLKISVITVCFNSEKYIETAIKSVINQEYPNIEYLIIDGNSKDKTIDIVSNYSDNVDILISEEDKGIYDAMNKGISLATGDIIGFLNSDDFYSSTKSLSNVMGIFNTSHVDCVFGNINYVSSNNPEKIIRKWSSGNFIKKSFKRGWHPAHPAFFVKKNIYQKYGSFKLKFKLAADFEIMLRFLERYQIINYYINKPLIHMRLGGATNKSFNNILKQNIECYKCFSENNMSVSPFYFIYRNLPKIKQFLP